VGGEVLVADEDEFAEHREALGYPEDVVDRATEALLWVRAALANATPPFDGSHRRWFATLDAMVPA
jgi:protein associated with RNAse G/E